MKRGSLRRFLSSSCTLGPEDQLVPLIGVNFRRFMCQVLTLSDLTSFDTWSGSLPFQIFVLTASRIQVDLEWLGGLCQHCVKIN